MQANYKTYEHLKSQLVQNPALDTVDLKGKKMSVEEIEKIAELLADVPIKKLILRRCKLKSEGLRAFLGCLQNNADIVSLDLSFNMLKDADIALLSGLLPNLNLHTVDLSVNNFTSAGTKALANVLPNTSIHTLILKSNRLGPQGVAQLMPFTTNIRVLDLSNNKLGADGFNAVVMHGAHLLSLNVSDNAIADLGMQYLVNQLPKMRLQSLDMRENGLTSQSLVYLSPVLKDSRLITLNIADNRIDASGLEHLAKHLEGTLLSDLLLKKNAVKNQGLDFISPVITKSRLLNVNMQYAGIDKQKYSSFTQNIMQPRFALAQKLLSFAKDGNQDALDQLLEKNASLSLLNLKGETLLHVAAESGQLHIVKYLLNRLSEKQFRQLLSLYNQDLKTPIDLASQHPLIKNYLTDDLEKHLQAKNLDKYPNSAPPIDPDDLEIGELIGPGSYGDVYHAEWEGISVVVKKLNFNAGNVVQIFQHEAKITAQCSHNNIVRLYGICEDNQSPGMVFEYMPKGSLCDVLASNDSLSWVPHRWQIALDVAQGLKYLHGRKIQHRQLKSSNVLLDESYRAKLSDFGLSRLKINSMSTTATPANKKKSSFIPWMAPELFQFKAKASFASDVWSFGVVMWELASCKLPYAEHQLDFDKIKADIKACKKLNISGHPPKVFADIIKTCWIKQPNDRPQAKDLVRVLKVSFKQARLDHESALYRCWQFDPALKKHAGAHFSPGVVYKMLPAGKADIQRVFEHYQHHHVVGMDIASIEVIYNPEMDAKFRLQLKELQHRHDNPAFNPKWPNKANANHRQKVAEDAEKLTKHYRDPDAPNVKLLPAWHGTDPGILGSILKTGYANLATTDAGFFGKGLYTTREAEYSARVYSKGVLLLNWVSYFSAYPVIDGDMNKLTGKGNHGNHDAHYVPVVPGNLNNPNEVNYYPIKPNQKKVYTEIVVFNPSQCLPRYAVKLIKSEPYKNPVLTAPQALRFFPHHKTDIDILLAARYVYNNYLSKPYTLNNYTADWELKIYDNDNTVINRPNHGLAHTLRTVVFAPLVVRYFLKQNKDQLGEEKSKKIHDSLAVIQLALLFFVAGRENDMGSKFNKDDYKRFRRTSAAAFENYVKSKKIKMMGDVIQRFKKALLGDKKEEAWPAQLLRLIHNLDVARCFQNVKFTYMDKHLGHANVQKLKRLGILALQHTGDRVMGGTNSQSYQPALFKESSLNVMRCLQNLASATEEWEKKQVKRIGWTALKHRVMFV